MELPGFIQSVVDALSPIAAAIGYQGMYIFGGICFFLGAAFLITEATQRTFVFEKGLPKIKRFLQSPTAKFLALTAVLAAIRNVLTFILPIPIIPGIVTWGHIIAGAFSAPVGAVFGLAGVWGYGVLGTVISDVVVGTLNIGTIGGIIGQTMPTYLFYLLAREPQEHNFKWVLKVLGITILAEGVLHAFALPFWFQTTKVFPTELAWGLAWPLFYIISMPQVILGSLILMKPIARLAARFKLTWKDLGYKLATKEETPKPVPAQIS